MSLSPQVLGEQVQPNRDAVAAAGVYDAIKRRATDRNLLASRVGRDIGPIPAVVNPARREACRLDFRQFCDTYFATLFYMAWSQDHLRVLSKTQECVLSGGQFAEAMARGSGKTTIAEVAVVWAAVYGHRTFPVLIGATEVDAEERLHTIREHLDGNDLLLEDFPEVCFPIRKLEGEPHRCTGQLCEGERTRVSWTGKQIVLPTIKGSGASGCIIKVAGITGRIRGLKFTRPDGKGVRPDLVILDDPQTDSSARSLSQSAERERVVAGAVLGLAGPGKKIAALMPCTVIRPGDMADNILDRDLHPEWNGERMKLVYAFPTDEKAVKLWEKYDEVRADSLRAERGMLDATEFYRANRELMDKGAVVAWPERFNPGELSALQHAYNLRLADEAAFQAEYQNDPIQPRDSVDDVGILSQDDIQRRLSGTEHGMLPAMATRVTASIDVQGRLLYWMVCAWAKDFTGWVIDYGTWPEQARERFTYADADRTLDMVFKGMGQEDQVAEGLVGSDGQGGVIDRVCGAAWLRAQDGASLRVERCLVDANYLTETVTAACRRSKHAGVVMCSRGRDFGRAARPLSDWKREQGDRVGHGWRIDADKKSQILFDANTWKTFVHNRLATGKQNEQPPGSLTLWGHKPARHRMLAEHLTSETRERFPGTSRVFDVWTLIKHRDNHLLDTLAGCAVAASELGVALRSMESAKQKERKKMKLSEMQGRRRA